MKRGIYFLIIGLAFVAAGIFMGAATHAAKNVIIILFSIYLIFDGIKGLTALRRLHQQGKPIKASVIAKGIIEIVLGAAAVITTASCWEREIVAKIFMYIVAADFIGTAITDFVDWIILTHRKYSAGGLLVEAGIDILFGVLLCLFPDVIGNLGIKVIGVLVIVVGTAVFCYGVHIIVMVHTLRKYGIDPKGETDQALADFEEVREANTKADREKKEDKAEDKGDE